MNAKTAGIVAIAASAGALAILFIYIPAVMFKIQEINNQVKQDASEFRVLAQESWDKITYTYGPNIGRRIRRQANKVKAIHKARDPTGYGGQSSYGSDNGATNYGSNGQENYGNSGSYGNRGYGDNQYEKSAAVYSSVICNNPAMDAAMEKAQQCGCNANRNCPAGIPGPPGQPGLDGQPGEPGKPGKIGQPGNSPTVTIICEDEASGGYSGHSESANGYGRAKRGYEETSSYRQTSGSNYGSSNSYGAGGYGKNCCRACPHGPIGPSGPPGTPGECGPKGFPGPAGRNGENGRPGNSGSPGKPGEPGATGKMGPPGSKGQDGTKGQKGAPGKKGKTGESGQKGPDGFAGKDGAPGLDGAAGQTGGPGYPGDKGQDGKPGAAGIPGEPGQDAHYCPCPERGNGENAGVNQGYETGQAYSHPAAVPQNYNAQSYPSSNTQAYDQPPSIQPTQGSGYVQRAAHGAVLKQPKQPENFLPPGYDPASEAVKASPYFSRLAKLKRLRQMAHKAKS